VIVLCGDPIGPWPAESFRDKHTPYADERGGAVPVPYACNGAVHTALGRNRKLRKLHKIRELLFPRKISKIVEIGFGTDRLFAWFRFHFLERGAYPRAMLLVSNYGSPGK
jgi:hypothetical protein